jgi:DNA-binding NarL/FixJ family response regulator
MLHEFRTLVAHDDGAQAQAIAGRLRAAFPDMLVVTTDDPLGHGHDFDVLIVDCRTRGPDLLRLLRAESPDALILGYADGVERAALKDLVNAGLDGLFEAAVQADADLLVGSIRAHVTRRAEAPHTQGLLGVMRSMADLVRQWNRRLDRLEVS